MYAPAASVSWSSAYCRRVCVCCVCLCVYVCVHAHARPCRRACGVCILVCGHESEQTYLLPAGVRAGLGQCVLGGGGGGGGARGKILGN